MNVQDDKGDTPLHIEARRGDLESVKILLSMQPSLSIENSNGYKASVVAVMEGHSEIAEELETDLERLRSAKTFAEFVLEEEHDAFASAEDILTVSSEYTGAMTLRTNR